MEVGAAGEGVSLLHCNWQQVMEAGCKARKRAACLPGFFWVLEVRRAQGPAHVGQAMSPTGGGPSPPACGPALPPPPPPPP